MNLSWAWQLEFSAASSTGLVNPACDYAVHMPWIQVVTWNDWPEGTSIEPAQAPPRSYGLAPLRTTRVGSALFKRADPPGGWQPDAAGTDAILSAPLRVYTAAQGISARCGASSRTCQACHPRNLSATTTAATCAGWRDKLATASVQLLASNFSGANETATALINALSHEPDNDSNNDVSNTAPGGHAPAAVAVVSACTSAVAILLAAAVTRWPVP